MVGFMPPRISVVVPIYNVEEYLEPCLDSIAAQTFGDLEYPSMRPRSLRPPSRGVVAPGLDVRGDRAHPGIIHYRQLYSI